MNDDPRRQLPAVDRVVTALGHRPEPDSLVTESARQAVDEARAALVRGDTAPSLESLVDSVRDALDAAAKPSLRRVINASGVILQTNLGRAPLGKSAMKAMADVAAASNLEFELARGERGSRHEHVRELVAKATGAEDGIAVNNNAAALFFVLQAFCQGREVIVSRGQAVEIGGGFRIPDVLRQSGAQLVEVGTTNRTYARDYAEAIGPDTVAILKVHTSNFQVVGFTAEPSVAELSAVAHAAGVLLFDDLGSGCLVETTKYGLAHEPMVQESLAAGTDLALFSGDKLLGGPQAGIIAGRSELVGLLRRHPLARALRLDKFAIAALNATLNAYVMQREREDVPVWEMLARDVRSLRARARKWAAAAGGRGETVGSTTMVGGGSLPGQGVPTVCAAFRDNRDASTLAALLRTGDPPIIGRISDGALLLDPRTVDPANDAAVAARVTAIFRQD